MDDSTKRLLQQLLRRIPLQMLQTTLGKWGRLTEEQLQSLDFTQPKSAFTENLLALCQESGLAAKHITELEMIYVIDNDSQGMWHAFQLLDAEVDAHSIELTQFKEQFKAHLTQLIRHVSIKIKKHTDEAIWIRIAWGDGFSRPNHLRPTYVVHHLQTPYVFVTSITAKHKPLLDQALVLATRYSSIKDANLSGRRLTAIRDLIMSQYQQCISMGFHLCSKLLGGSIEHCVGVFPTMHPNALQEMNPLTLNPNIKREQAENTENRLKMACETFGDGALPQLQTALYKLETKFKDDSNKIMTGREEPFKSVVRFSSTNILESLRHCMSSGICSTPAAPLLSSITQKGRNYFVVVDKGLPPSSQTPNSKN